ncbi:MULTISPECIES: hypothetical protein [Pseudomonas]|uniref:hypothetical protein n=1 Tax=Pseudomonas sp. MIL9 TaxID=2807620 RepID=UPI00194E57FA|nr:hypothetical protein [Pseudomonas sp. MIL9]MBM6447232.1 hypothetical protein [Pseudomonas sp. MIL9]
MAHVTVQDGVKASFYEILSAANRPSPDASLTTAVLSPEIRAEQFSRFASLRTCIPQKLQLHGAGYIIRFACDGYHYLAINTEGMTVSEKGTLSEYFATKGLYDHAIEECFFLYLRFHLGRLYRLKAERREAQAAADILDISKEQGYSGHEISDLISYHEEVQCYKLDMDSNYNSENIWSIAASLAANIPILRTSLMVDDVARNVERVSLLAPHLAENAYTALTSIHWKYIFFELYKCLEGMFFLSWGLKAKQVLKLSTALEAHKIIREVTSFKEQEKTSIEGLFELLTDELLQQVLGYDVESFKNFPAEVTKPQVGRRIYKIRNQLIHQEDYEDREALDLENENWADLIMAMCDIVCELFASFKAEIQDAKV